MTGNHEHEGCLVESHGGNNYLPSCLGESGRVVGSGCRVQLYNPTRVLGFNFSTRSVTFPKKFQPDPSLFGSNTRLELEYPIRHDQSSQNVSFIIEIIIQRLSLNVHPFLLHIRPLLR